ASRAEANPAVGGGTGQGWVKKTNKAPGRPRQPRGGWGETGVFPADGLDLLGALAADCQGKRMIEEPAGREGQPVDEGAAAGKLNPAVRLLREGEEADDVGPRRWGTEEDPRVAADVVVVLGQDEPLRRDALEHGVHRRAEDPVRRHVGDEGFSLEQRDGEAIHIPRLGQAAVDRGGSDAQTLGGLRLVVGLDLEEFG